jgi:hypothetical protein
MVFSRISSGDLAGCGPLTRWYAGKIIAGRAPWEALRASVPAFLMPILCRAAAAGRPVTARLALP